MWESKMWICWITYIYINKHETTLTVFYIVLVCTLIYGIWRHCLEVVKTNILKYCYILCQIITLLLMWVWLIVIYMDYYSMTSYLFTYIGLKYSIIKMLTAFYLSNWVDKVSPSNITYLLHISDIYNYMSIICTLYIQCM